MPQRKNKFLAAGLTCIVVLIAAGCSSSPSSSSSSTGTSTGGGGSTTITVGVLTDLSGPAASEFGTAMNGIKAGVGVAATKGYKSSTSSPTRQQARPGRWPGHRSWWNRTTSSP